MHFGETVKVLDRVNEEWWWVELEGVVGYVPANHLSNEPLLTEDEKWENEEYFNSYGQLVGVISCLVYFDISKYRNYMQKCSMMYHVH